MKALYALKKKGEIPEICDLQEVLNIPQTGEVDELTIETLDLYIKKTKFDTSAYIEKCISECNLPEEEIPDLVREKAIKVILKHHYECELEKIHKFMQDCYEEEVKKSGIQIMSIPYDSELEGSDYYEKAKIKMRQNGGQIFIRRQGGGDMGGRQEVMTNAPERVKMRARDVYTYARKNNPKAFKKLRKSKSFQDAVARNAILDVSSQGTFKAYTDDGAPVDVSRMVGESQLSFNRAFAGENKAMKGLGSLGLYSNASAIGTIEDENPPTEPQAKEEDCPDQPHKVGNKVYITDCKGVKKGIKQMSDGTCYNPSTGDVVDCITGLSDDEGVDDGDTEKEPKDKGKGTGSGDGTGRPCPPDLKDVVAFQQWMVKKVPGILGKYGSKKDGVDGKCGKLTNAAWEKYKKAFLNPKEDPKDEDKISKTEKLAFIKSEMERKGLKFRPQHFSTDETINKTYKALKQGADKAESKTTEEKKSRDLVKEYNEGKINDDFFTKDGTFNYDGASAITQGGKQAMQGLNNYLAGGKFGADIGSLVGGKVGGFLGNVGNKVGKVGRNVLLPLEAGAVGLDYLADVFHPEMEVTSQIEDDAAHFALTALGYGGAGALYKAVMNNPSVKKQIATLAKKGNIQGIKTLIKNFANKTGNVFKKGKVTATPKTPTSSVTKTASGTPTPKATASRPTGTSQYTDRQYNKYEEFYEKFRKDYNLSKKDAANKAMEQMERLMNQGFRKQGGNLFIRKRNSGGVLMPGKYIKASKGIGMGDFNLTRTTLKRRWDPIIERFVSDDIEDVKFNTDLTSQEKLATSVLPQASGEVAKPFDKRYEKDPVTSQNILSSQKALAESMKTFEESVKSSPAADPSTADIGTGEEQRLKEAVKEGRQEGGGEQRLSDTSRKGSGLNTLFDRYEAGDIAKSLFEKHNVGKHRFNKEYIEKPGFARTIMAPEAITQRRLPKIADPTLRMQAALSQNANTQALEANRQANYAATVQQELGNRSANEIANRIGRKELEQQNRAASFEADVAEDARKKSYDNAIFGSATNMALETGRGQGEIQDAKTRALLAQRKQAALVQYQTANENLVNDWKKENQELLTKELRGELTSKERTELENKRTELGKRRTELKSKYAPDYVKDLTQQLPWTMRGVTDRYQDHQYNPNAKKGGRLDLQDQKELSRFKAKVKAEVAKRKRKQKALDEQWKQASKINARAVNQENKKLLKLHLEANKRVNAILDKYLKG